MKTVIASRSAKIRKFGILHRGVQFAQLRFGVGQDHGVLHGDEPVVDALREPALAHRVVHQPPGNVDLPHGAAGPGDHLGGEHRAHAELLGNGDEHRVDAGGVGGGELGDVPDAHHLRRIRVAPVHFGVPLQRRHEAEADRLDHRIDEVADAPPVQRLDAPVKRVESGAEIGDHHHACAPLADLPGDLEIGPVDAQHQLRAGVHRPQDLVRLEGVDADAHTLTAQLPDHLAELRKDDSRGATDVDDVSATGAKRQPPPRARRRAKAWARC